MVNDSYTVETRPPWRPWWRWLISAALAFHVAAVFMGPFAFSTQTPGGRSSNLAEWLMPVFRPYVQAAYLEHGYAFFAPDPGPSHLVEYQVDFDDGRPSIAGTFPNLKEHRPRLLYHRHFMLSEQLHSSFTPASLANLAEREPRPLDPIEQSEWKAYFARQQEQGEAAWERSRRAYEARWESFERHL